MKRLLSGAALLLVAAAASCHDEADASDFNGSALTQALVPASPTNKYADDAHASALGQQFFFDLGFSSDGTVGCVTCHDPAHDFSDVKSRSVGVRRQTGDRHAMPVTAAVFHPFLLWDGRADSVWLQPLKATENPKEMDFTRVEVARRIAGTYRTEYEAVFGELPDLASMPARAKPGDASWSKMTSATQESVNRIFANYGKAIEAYERKIICSDTKFDRWLRGDGDFSDTERSGGEIFRQSNCPRCHSGPSFSDGKFHDLGIPSTDRGRIEGAAELAADPFNGAGEFSDDPTAGAAKLALAASESAQNGSFRTASLRGVGQRTFFGHASHERTLRGFLSDVYRGGGGGGGGGGRGRNDATVGTRDPLLNGVNVDDDDLDDLIAFLHTLDCPAPSADLVSTPLTPSAAP